MNDSSKQEAHTEDKPNPKASSKQPEKVVTKTSSTNQPKQKSRSAIAWLAIFLVILATMAGYLAFKQLTQHISQLSSSIDALKNDTSRASNELQSKTRQVSNQLSDLNSHVEQLEQSADERITLLQQQVGKNRRQWLIAEAEYLVSVANTRLQLAGDVDTAIVALQTADQRLKENGDPLTFAIRQQIAKEINLLNSTFLPDTVGLSSQLLALEDAVSSMGIKAPHAGTAQAPEIGKGDASPIPENIQDTLNDAWESFSKLIVVRRSDKPLAALMTPERIELIRKNLALKLESARLALINQQQALYTANIAIAKTWLGDYFDNNNPSVKTALKQLDKLENTVIKAELPSIALSLKMLRDLPLLSMSAEDSTAPSITITTPASIEKKDLSSQPPAEEPAPLAIDNNMPTSAAPEPTKAEQ
ncbi:uroporphyrinogen-III C-methyltransferase [Cycloclasticus pugetii]|uniref:uroporphyrinogen-III C-methyltransferase n=1 Tax=Cycloclasticus pugetii TaxID=34068 RepID=UPI002409724C|nr:uroporphyrinogen-III C-methyltransferase [Cycloclasticus pugetii]MDF1829165.1 uroporphyrinogen-III C-methyltransferase [Cycloclasticus pugetii]